jgi:hypothetical protein
VHWFSTSILPHLKGHGKEAVEPLPFFRAHLKRAETKFLHMPWPMPKSRLWGSQQALSDTSQNMRMSILRRNAGRIC